MALRLALSPALTIPGYWIATGAGLAWGAVLGRARLHRVISRFEKPREVIGREVLDDLNSDHPAEARVALLPEKPERIAELDLEP